MRIVALEEHISLPELTSRIPADVKAARGWPGYSDPDSPLKKVEDALHEVGAERLAKMDNAGITMQVLSVSGAGADVLSPADGPPLARAYNDALARIVATHPDRFAGFTHLPMTAPQAAADELERTVKTYNFRGGLINGLTQDQFLDAPQFAPLLERFESLGVPLYLHPNVPPASIRKTYYEGLSPTVSTMLGMAGFGWHAETAIHVLRLILSGTLERYPKLQLIIGHMGEMLPVMMARCDNVLNQGVTKLPRTISQTLQQQVYITTSGIFTQPPLLAALATFGIDRILFSVDYPYATNAQGRAFLDAIDLPADEVAKIAHQNADRVLNLSQ